LKESSVDPIAAVAATGGEEPNPINGTLDSWRDNDEVCGKRSL
jgi:hypothetical protein